MDKKKETTVHKGIKAAKPVPPYLKDINRSSNPDRGFLLNLDPGPAPFFRNKGDKYLYEILFY